MPRGGVKGNKGGQKGRSGRKPREIERDVLKLMDESWPLARRKAAVKKHAQLAEKGDAKSFAILMAYVYGKPVETKQITGEDGGAVILKVIYERARTNSKAT